MKTYTAPPPIADVRLEVVLFFFELLNIGNDYGRFKNCSNGLRLPFSSSGCSTKKSGDPHEGGKPEEDGGEDVEEIIKNTRPCCQKDYPPSIFSWHRKQRGRL